MAGCLILEPRSIATLCGGGYPGVAGYYTSVVDCRRLEGAVVIEAMSGATQIEIPEDRGLK